MYLYLFTLFPKPYKYIVYDIHAHIPLLEDMIGGLVQEMPIAV